VSSRSDLLILGVFLCGLLMVTLGLILALRGTVQVRRPKSGTSRSALALEFKGLKMSTDYQAIGVSLVGLLFASLAAWMDLNGTMTIHVKARLIGDDVSGVQVFAAVPLEPVMMQDGGHIEDDISFVPNQSMIYIVPLVPGLQSPKPKQMAPTSWFSNVRSVDVGDVTVKSPGLAMPAPSATQVATPPPEPGSRARSGY
jgi:hypothetical protein